jgi:hypothetical protein
VQPRNIAHFLKRLREFSKRQFTVAVYLPEALTVVLKIHNRDVARRIPCPDEELTTKRTAQAAIVQVTTVVRRFLSYSES